MYGSYVHYGNRNPTAQMAQQAQVRRVSAVQIRKNSGERYAGDIFHLAETHVCCCATLGICEAQAKEAERV